MKRRTRLGTERPGSAAPGAVPRSGRAARTPDEPAPRAAERWIALACVLVVVLVIAGARLRSASTPLERDEGEYAYAGQLLLHGVPPYRFATNMKFPGTYAADALAMAAFGESARGVRTGLVLVTTLTALLVFALGSRLGRPRFAALAAIGCAVLGADRWMLGLFAHATHYVLPPLLGALLLLVPRTGRPSRARIASAGLLLGLAVLVKQHAVFYLPLAAALVLGTAPGRWRARAAWLDVALLAVASVVPFALTCGALAAVGVFPAFWFWTVSYARAYVSEVGVAHALAAFGGVFGHVVPGTLVFWLAGGLGLAALAAPRWDGRTRLLLAGLALASLLAISPGFFFREHYFLLLVPALALLAAVAFETLGALAPPRARTAVVVAAFAAATAFTAAHEWRFWFALPPRELSHAIYPGNPFVEAQDVADTIRTHSAPGDEIAVLGSEPEIYFTARRRSATPFIYMYPLFEPQPFAPRMRGALIAQVEARAPRFVVVADDRLSWTQNSDADPDSVIGWAQRWTTTHYTMTAQLQLVPFGEAHAFWGAAATTAPPEDGPKLYLFEKRAAGAAADSVSRFPGRSG